MKINEKTLCSYWASNTPSDRQGWLHKRGEVNKSFQKRWCMLKGNLLFYGEKPTDKEPIGVIILEGCRVELAEDETEFHAFKIIFYGDGKSGGRTYILGTSNMEDLEAWMKLVASSSYDYLKLMIAELQHQLSELEDLDQHRQLQQQEGAPCPPPRTRVNPFNKSYGLRGRSKKWPECHKVMGQKILEDRNRWAKAEKEATVTMVGDKLTATTIEASP